ncbi:MAG TPA: NAD-dependent epimerase/dehydratase family protein [Nitrospira sp.]|nr:NAD-dependent epimerase/dehydratase family protein [Nitrospira sp.]
MNELAGKVILVTGANGFIGAHLVTRLSEVARVKLLLFSTQPRQSTRQDVIWLKGELARLTPDYWQSRDIGHIDYVFHLGAFIPRLAAEANRISNAIEDNVLGTHALLQSLPGKIQKLIFSSTIDVYAQLQNEEVLTERSPVRPSTLYGSSKLFCEHLISAWAEDTGNNYAILRYGHIFGPGEERYGKLIPMIIRNLLAGKAPIIYGDGSALRDYLYVGDVVEATIRAALVQGNLEPTNIVHGKSTTVKMIARHLIRLVGSDKEIELLLDKPNGSSMRFDNQLMTRSLGSWTMTSLDEGLAAEVAAFRVQ